jgi:nitroreductase
MEVGVAAQNVALQAVALGLGSLYVGAFRDDTVHELLELPEDHAPLALLPVGRPAD